MVHSDVLTHLTQRKLLPGALFKLRHIVTLYDEIFHIVAGKEISQVEQLNGQPVVIGKPGSGSEMSAQTLFTILGVKPKLSPVILKVSGTLSRSQTGSVSDRKSGKVG